MTSCLSWTSVVFQESSNETLPGLSESDFLALALSKINKKRNYISNQNRSKSTGIEKIFSYTDMVLRFQTMSQFGWLFPLVWNSTLTVTDLEILYRYLTLGEWSELGLSKKNILRRSQVPPWLTHTEMVSRNQLLALWMCHGTVHTQSFHYTDQSCSSDTSKGSNLNSLNA